MLVTCATIVVCAGCASESHEHTGVSTGHPHIVPNVTEQAARAGLTVDQVDAATRVTKTYVDGEDAKVRFATAQALDGPAESSNTGEACSSSALLRVVVAGDFPRIVTSGGPPGGDGTDGEVRAVTLTADAVTEKVCHMSVSTGSPEADASAVKLHLDD